ncbi:Uncharacterized phage-associated protein [Nocardioides exalbidus]|uniref:Uncharacterized phage-associated protein n=1 Tax=Nocardioides exalbidus TaxID=402596 RepID=A0A1H4NV39_9ACTN|nr:type II toxin-antitoxin system antitoxin SocA domain-containing protein [Nocardioides exalbidus]SEB99087.1 Uncharacterized phage-associated protein [Nocardioides exalbidus]
MHANDVAEVIVARLPGISAMKLQKLLYYVQSWHLAITDRPLFDEDFLGWSDGPVVYEVWKARQDHRTRRHSDGSATAELPYDASVIMELVLAEYGGRSGDELSALIHLEAPWNDARVGLRDGEQGRSQVSKESMARFFRDHRQLGSRSAADLAATGLYIPVPDATVDVKDLLENFDMPWPDDEVEESLVSYWPIDEIDHDNVGPSERA